MDVFSRSIERVAEWCERGAACRRIRRHPQRQDCRAQSVHDLGVCGVFGVFGLLPRLPLSRGPRRVSRARMDSPGLFCAAHHAHYSRRGDCADDFGHAAARVAREI